MTKAHENTQDNVRETWKKEIPENEKTYFIN